MVFLERNYDRGFDSKCEEQLTKAENMVACLSQIAEFLKQADYDKVADNLTEVKKMEGEIVKLWDIFNKLRFERAVLRGREAPAAAAVGGANTPTVKIISELKPDTLSHDAQAGSLRVWIRKFEAYYHASGMQAARIQVQQAYFLNCLDDELSLRVSSMLNAATTVLGNNDSCMVHLKNVFSQRYPLLLRRRQFFTMQQQAGQDERAFLESLKLSAAEADVAGMDVQDALCMVLVTGLRDMKLKEKLSELEVPSLHAFSVLVDAYMHSKATCDTAVGAKASPYQQQKKRGGGNNNNNSGGTRTGISDAEKKRRVIMKGKCFRCGKSEHFANKCTLPKDVKCHKCNALGHTQAACIKGQGQARVSSEEAPADLALEYDAAVEYAQASFVQPRFAQASFAQGQAFTAVAQYSGYPNNSKPTPQVLL